MKHKFFFIMVMLLPYTNWSHINFMAVSWPMLPNSWYSMMHIGISTWYTILCNSHCEWAGLACMLLIHLASLFGFAWIHFCNIYLKSILLIFDKNSSAGPPPLLWQYECRELFCITLTNLTPQNSTSVGSILEIFTNHTARSQDWGLSLLIWSWFTVNHL